MSITKMTLVDIKGGEQYLDEVLLRCLRSGIFHAEQASSLSEYSIGVPIVREDNPYTRLLEKITEISVTTPHLELTHSDFEDLDLADTALTSYVEEISTSIKTCIP